MSEPVCDVMRIVALLAQRHCDDLFVRECKDGQTYGRKHIRLDAWAMKRSWTRPKMFGYEIKVKRADFLRDTKWHEYLPLCNYFSFVCPRGIIRKEDVPKDVGLIWVTRDGTGLHTMRAAKRRDINVPLDLLFYILICRAQITEPGVTRVETGLTGAEFWRLWLARKGEWGEIGRGVADAIAHRFRVDEMIIAELQREVQRLNKEVEEIEHRM